MDDAEEEPEEHEDRQVSLSARLLGSLRLFSEDTPSTMSEMSVFVGVVTALMGKVVECSDSRCWLSPEPMMKCFDSEMGANICRRRG